MKPFRTHRGLVATLDRANVDTDQIIPKQFLKRIERTGFGQFLFFDWRFHEDGSDNAEFELNRPPFQGASILVTRRNFGSGSSREHAVWALADYGLRAIIAPSFADIFYNNCFKNGVLPIRLPEDAVEQIFQRVAQTPGYQLLIDLENCRISDAGQLNVSFSIDPFRQHSLLEGLDDIAVTLQQRKKSLSTSEIVVSSRLSRNDVLRRTLRPMTMPSLTQAAEAIYAGSASPTSLVTECLQRIEQTDQALHAWVHVDGQAALRSAESLERELRRGTRRGPLHGIPLGVKDIIDVAGMPTRAGSPLTDARDAETDAPVVARLRAAGAIVIGKTVTTQFACFDPAETVNPWDAHRTPGGSSSGSAVAVATGSCYAALGTQTGGSILRPAAYCGVVGLKPTVGRWSMQGIVPVSLHLDHVGPLVRSVADVGPLCAAVEGSVPSGNCGEFDETAPPTFGLPTTFFREKADPFLLPIFDSAVASLVVAGAQVEDVHLSLRFDEVLAKHRCIMAVELAEYHRLLYARQSDRYAPGIAMLIEEGRRTSALDYAAALRHRMEFIDQMRRAFGRGPSIWVTPATTTPAPLRETTGDPSFNAPWSYCGFPAITLPGGQSADGLPIGLQLIACDGQDESLLRAALWCERVAQQEKK